MVPMPDPAPRKAGIPWYEREDYPQILALVEDPHVLAPAYDQWLAAARNNEQEAERAGVTVVRVAVKPDVFARWCAEHGLRLDSRARMRFVNEAMERGA
jgi:hypothetical protein